MFRKIQIFHQLLKVVVVISILVKFECFFIQLTHIAVEKHGFDVFLQGLKLVVLVTVVVRDYGNPVVHLVDVGVSGIVYKHHLGQISINNSKILHMHSFWGLHTVFSKKSMVNIFAFGIKIVNNDISVTGMTSSENNNFEFLGEVLKNICGMWTDINSSFNYFAGGKNNWQLDIVRVIKSFVTVN